MYSSSSDIAKLGRAILNYTLLSGPQTRRWMKPDTLDSDVKSAIGAPWGVRRIQLDQKYRVVDTYDKGGSINSWISFLVLIPDYDVGFIVLIAGNNLNDLEMQILDSFGDAIIPSLEATAKDQAGTLYAGEYSAIATSSSNSPDATVSDAKNGSSISSRAAAMRPRESTPTSPEQGQAEDTMNPTNNTLSDAMASLNSSSHAATTPLNSSITIVTDDKPGLGVTSWISNGTDMRLTVAQLMTNYSDPYWIDLSIRLYPTDLVSRPMERGRSRSKLFSKISLLTWWIKHTRLRVQRGLAPQLMFMGRWL